MEILIDENLPKKIAKGLHLFQEGSDDSVQVIHITDKFEEGISDEDWIESINGSNSIVVTRDFNIKRTQNQCELVRNSDIGMIFLRGKDLKYWDLVKVITKNWEEIVYVGRKRRPFAYRFTSKSSKLEKLTL